MVAKIAAATSIALCLCFAAAGCRTKPPRQAESADALQDKGADMSTGQDQSGNIADQGQGGAEKMHEKCCAQCKKGLAKDRTGAAAETIPCTDFTDTLDPFCLEHFRGKKTMASACK